jgi:hypothetical protein
MCDVARDRWLTDYVVMDQGSDRKGIASSRRKIVVEAVAARLVTG